MEIQTPFSRRPFSNSLRPDPRVRARSAFRRLTTRPTRMVGQAAAEIRPITPTFHPSFRPRPANVAFCRLLPLIFENCNSLWEREIEKARILAGRFHHCHFFTYQCFTHQRGIRCTWGAFTRATTRSPGFNAISSEACLVSSTASVKPQSNSTRRSGPSPVTDWTMAAS